MTKQGRAVRAVAGEVMSRSSRNRLLAALAPEDRALLDPHLEAVTLNQKDVLVEPNQPIEHVYFFEGGLSSEIALSPDGERIEVGCVGREGLSGVPVVLGVDRTPHRSFIQIGGPALRMKAIDLQEAMEASRALRALLLRYAHVFMIQIAATALSDGRYTLEQRLARWLLMGHDRVSGEDLPFTHDFLSLMLGVRRPGVTEALHILEGERVIKAQRVLITILDRPQLERKAGGSYGVPEAEYERLIGPCGRSQGSRP
jgi:CRP-like cAMP-binding protein